MFVIKLKNEDKIETYDKITNQQILIPTYGKTKPKIIDKINNKNNNNSIENRNNNSEENKEIKREIIRFNKDSKIENTKKSEYINWCFVLYFFLDVFITIYDFKSICFINKYFLDITKPMLNKINEK